MSILISELSTTLPLVFSVWTSPSASRDLVTESPRERQDRPELESSSASLGMMPSSGSLRPSEARFSTEDDLLASPSLLFFLRSERLSASLPSEARESLRQLLGALQTILLCQTTRAAAALILLIDFLLMMETNLLFSDGIGLVQTPHIFNYRDCLIKTRQTNFCSFRTSFNLELLV